jgi:hypothetical protein
MTAPLAPVVIGPVHAVPTVQVQVNNVLPDALVQVLSNGSAVGHASSTSTPGVVWVPATVPLQPGDKITATQTYEGSAGYVHVTPGVASPASPSPVTVAAVPSSLPTPVFQSLVSRCSNAVWLANLIPGATVTIDQGGPALGGGLVQFPAQWFSLTGLEPTPGQPLQAFQAFGSHTSPIGLSADVIPEVTSLPAPVLATPLRDCQTFLDLSHMVPGAEVVVVNGGFTDTGTSPAASYTADLQPLKTGLLTAQQYFPRCEKVPRSPVAHYGVVTEPLPAPVVGYALCPSVGQLTVGNLLPGEILTASAVVPGPTGFSVTELGSQGISSTSATVPLTPLPAGTVAVRLSVGLCGLETEPPPGYVTVPVSTSSLPIGPPDLQAPLYDCVSQVVVTGAHPGSLLTVFSGVNALANPVVAAAGTVVIPLMAPLVTGESVRVAQTGCNASGQSAPRIVLPIPKLTPVPVIRQPVLSDATSVTVSGILPGAQVVLYIDGIAAVQVTALDTTSSVPLPPGALADARFIQVTQELCGKPSTRLDAGPGWAQVQTPAPLPGRGLKGNSGYIFQNSCGDLTGVTIEIDVNEEIGGSGPSYVGFGFQLNCWSQGVTDVNAWQQFVIAVGFGSTPSPNITAFVNSWPYNWNGSASDDIINDPQTLASHSGFTLSAGYHLSIQLTNQSPGNQVSSATFAGHDNLGNVFTPLTVTLQGLSDHQGGTISASQLAPIVAFQVLLVGPDNTINSTLTTGQGKMTISADADFIATNALPTGGCWSFDSGLTGTGENSNATYTELPAAPSQTFVQYFSV